MNSILIYTATEPVDASGVRDLRWVFIGTHPTKPESAYHAVAGTPIPAGATVVISGATAWNWTNIKSLVPKAQWERLAEASYNDPVKGRVRVKIADLPAGVAVAQTDLPPHFFYGES